MRTLVISDIHLGQRGGVSVLTRPRPLAVFLEALDDCDRLVLLGDVVELQETHWSHSFPVAEPVLRAIAERLGPDKQLLLVPGNHDHALVRGWARSQGPDLERESRVPPDASWMLERVLSWLEATRVEVHYPAVWLADGVWATHGHYLNHYLQPTSSWGLHRPGRPRPETPEAFEYIPRPPAAPPRRGGPPDRWLDRFMPARLAPVTAHLLGVQMQRHALPAMAAAADALGVDARWVIFGHVHRRGPRERDDQALWTSRDGATALLNTGSWRHEPVIVHGLGPEGDYWPGGAVAIDAEGVPRSVGLLDGLSERELLGGDAVRDSR